MDNTVYPTLNTREFIAKWHSAVEQQLVADLGQILPRLAGAPRGAELGNEQYLALAHHMAYALQVAGSPNGGIQAALQYLKQMAGDEDETPQPG
jgi:hypothetical protein